MRSSLLVSTAIIASALLMSCGDEGGGGSSGSGGAAGTGGGASGTGGAPTGPSMAAFEGSGCKKESSTTSGTIAQPLTEDDVYAGLQCVKWDTIDGGFRIGLTNFEGACGAEWQGQVATQGQDVELRLVNPDCMIAACGSCIYDWTFDVRMSASEGGDTFSLVVDPCPGEQAPDVESVQLPLATEPSGELCRYADAHALGWQASALDTCGAAYMPCREASGMCGMGSTAEPCDPDLVCTEGTTEGVGICHAACQTDADCVPETQMKCDGTVCRPKNPW